MEASEAAAAPASIATEELSQDNIEICRSSDPKCVKKLKHLQHVLRAHMWAQM